MAALVSLAPGCGNRLWITEVNWPLEGHGPYAPTSGHECVDEATAARYLEEYHRIAYASGLVERVYWWQLIAPGYGLVADEGGRLRPRPAFHALRRLLAGGLTDTGTDARHAT